MVMSAGVEVQWLESILCRVARMLSLGEVLPAFRRVD
jgi:hypothetical protein